MTDPLIESWRRSTAKAARRATIVKLLDLARRRRIPTPPADARPTRWAAFWFTLAKELAETHEPGFRLKGPRDIVWDEMRLCELVADFWHEDAKEVRRSQTEILECLVSTPRYEERWGGIAWTGLRRRLREGLACRFVKGIVLGGGRPPELRQTFVEVFRLRPDP